MQNIRQVCNYCIMDTSDPGIEFDEHGICNHCRHYREVAPRVVVRGAEGKARLASIVHRIKEAGRAKPYDCILGLSGGVDSSYVAYLATSEYGLRPLGVHLDNGWNTDVAEENIRKLVDALDLDLYTYRIDWDEFRDLQLSFFKASVIDIEMLTDHAIAATLANVARKRRLRYILQGANVTTEGIMPKSWVFPKWDARNIRAIHSWFGQKPMRTFPTYGLYRLLFGDRIRGIHYVNMLNYIDYNRQDAVALLKREVSWEHYGKKHYESVFTRFYQRYILPQKFGVDKRRAHLSTVICSGQMTREEALEELKEPPYENPEELAREKDYVLTKLGITQEEFDQLMSLPQRSHLDYPNSQRRYKQLSRIKKPLRLMRSIVSRSRL